MMRWALRPQGEIELEAGNFGKAVELLERAKSLLPGVNSQDEEYTLFLDALARAYFLSGDLERARREYETISRLNRERLAEGDTYVRSFYRLGQVFEKMGKKKEARANYRKFLELWKNADPGLAEVEEAKKRLAALD